MALLVSILTLLVKLSPLLLQLVSVVVKTPEQKDIDIDKQNEEAKNQAKDSGRPA